MTRHTSDKDTCNVYFAPEWEATCKAVEKVNVRRLGEAEVAVREAGAGLV